MKFIFSLLIVGLNVGYALNSYSQSKVLTINVQNKTVRETFNEIEKNSEFIFIYYDNDALELDKKVSINVTEVNITTILNKLFESTNIQYIISDRQIALSKKADDLSNPESTVQQTIQISGTVKDAAGEPMPGVNIVIKGTTTGQVTDINGKYTINVPNRDAILVFSFIGYISQEMTVADQRILNITLIEDSKLIEEVVVVGYGVQRKESVVGSIVQTSSEELMKSGNVTDLKQALTGRLPGVTTTMSTGEPGGFGDGSSATSIFIRGRNSWNNSQPLILVDNVERNMDNIDMSEVESISVLKDASATAVFGVKGANGVILITTKRGKNARPELSFSYDATALMISKLPDKLDSYDALRLRNESIERDVALNEILWTNYTPQEILRRYRERDYPEYEMLYPNVDWKKALFKDVGWSHRASLNIRGGTDFVKYFGSLSYLHEGDMFKEYDNYKGYDPNYNFNRFNFRSNFDFNLTKTTILKINLAGYFSQKNTNYSFYSSGSGTNPLIWGAAYRMPPDVFLPQYADGTWGISTNASETHANPVAQANNLGVWERRTTSLNADIALEQKLDFITKGLSVSGAFFYDNSIQTIGGINDVQNHVRAEPDGNTPETFVYPDRYTGPGQDPSEYTEFAIINPSSEFDWIVRPWSRVAESVSAVGWGGGGMPITRRMMYQVQLNYARKFNVHNVGATAIFKREEYARGSMYPSYREDWVFRATYDYDSRYFFETNGAYNGSEQFSPDYRFDFFPSFAAGWYLSNEKFFNIDWINRLKFRYSLGWAGDDQGIGQRYLYMAQYAYGGKAFLQNTLLNTNTRIDGNYIGNNPSANSPYIFYKETAVANPDAHWEKAKKSNYGVELGLWNDLISVNFDYFTEERMDILIRGAERAIPPYFGTTPPPANLGKVDTRGFELQVNLNKRTSFGLEYWASATMTHTRNKVKFRDDPQLQESYLNRSGYPIGQTKTTIRTGFYRNWDEVYASVPQSTNDANKIPGFYNILDFNGDGIITTNEDSAPYGYPDVPENTYNLTLGASYKGFSATVQFYGVTNVTRQVPLENFFSEQSTVYGHALDFWSKDNPNASSFLPRFLTAGSFYGDYFYYDGSYIRLKTAEIAYNFQKPVLNKLGISGLKLFVNGNNLWFWSRLPDDREDSWNGGTAHQGAYPMLKRINFGFNITF